jgi:hypothetical protein
MFRAGESVGQGVGVGERELLEQGKVLEQG